jgi:hypothetical protein
MPIPMPIAKSRARANPVTVYGSMSMLRPSPLTTTGVGSTLVALENDLSSGLVAADATWTPWGVARETERSSELFPTVPSSKRPSALILPSLRPSSMTWRSWLTYGISPGPNWYWPWSSTSWLTGTGFARAVAGTIAAIARPTAMRRIVFRFLRLMTSSPSVVDPP